MHAGTYPRPTSPGPVPACPGRPARDACAHRRATAERRGDSRTGDLPALPVRSEPALWKTTRSAAPTPGPGAGAAPPASTSPCSPTVTRSGPSPPRHLSRCLSSRSAEEEDTSPPEQSQTSAGGHHLPTRRSGPVRRPRSTRRPRRGNPRLHRTRRPGQARRCGCEQPQVVPAQIHPAASGPWRGRTHIARRSVTAGARRLQDARHSHSVTPGQCIAGFAAGLWRGGWVGWLAGPPSLWGGDPEPSRVVQHPPPPLRSPAGRCHPRPPTHVPSPPETGSAGTPLTGTTGV